MAGVQIFAENREQAQELLYIGGKLAADLETTLSAYICNDAARAADYIAWGATEVLVLPSLAADQALEAYLPVLAAEAKSTDPDLILMAATFRCRELAARLAMRLQAGLCSDCIAICADRESKSLQMERLVYGGAAIQHVTCLTRPAMATIPPRLFAPAAPQEGRQGKIRELPAPPPSPLQVMERKKREAEGKDITQARVVVCAGRGIDKKEDLTLAAQLAHVLNGEVGCTRPISEEQHWLPEELCIGLSGVSVKPDLYIGLGVSGQVQHLTGIRDAKVICAVNKDEKAPLFAAADYGIVGDLYLVVPQLIAEFKKAKS